MSCVIDAVASEVRNYPNHYLNVAARSVIRHIKDEQHRWKESSGVARIPIALKLIAYGCASPVSLLAAADNACCALARKATGRPAKYANCHEVTAGLYLGNVKAANDIEYLRRMQIDCVVSLYPVDVDYPADIEHCKVMIKDKPHVSLEESIQNSMDVLDEALKSGRRVLVHCHHGASRSAAIVIAYLMLRCGMSYRQALEVTRRRRRTVRPNVGFREQLKALSERPRQQAHPGDWENLRLALERPFDARRLKQVDGLFHKCRFAGKQPESLELLTKALDRIACVPAKQLKDRQRRLLQQAQRIILNHGQRCWFYALRGHAAWQDFADYEAISVERLTGCAAEDQSSPASARALGCCIGGRSTSSGFYGEQVVGELAERYIDEIPPEGADRLNVYWPGGKTCLVQLAGRSFLFDPEFRPGVIEGPAKLSDCNPDAVLQSGDSLPSGVGTEHLQHLQAALFTSCDISKKAAKQGYRYVYDFAPWESARLDNKLTLTRLPAAGDKPSGGWALQSGSQTVLYFGEGSANESQATWQRIHKRFPKPAVLIMPIRDLEACERELSIAEFLDAEHFVPIRWDGDLGRQGDGSGARRIEQAVAKRRSLWGKVHVPLIGENFSP